MDQQHRSRRDFLKDTGVALGGVAASSALGQIASGGVATVQVPRAVLGRTRRASECGSHSRHVPAVPRSGPLR